MNATLDRCAPDTRATRRRGRRCRSQRRGRARTGERHPPKTASWRTHPLRSEDAHADQDSGSTLQTADRDTDEFLTRRLFGSCSGAGQHSRVNLRQFGHALASAFGRIFAARRVRRQAILSAPFPRRWKDFLETRSDHYRRLPAAYRAEFDRQVQIFLAEKRITGIETHVSDEVKLLVAASAVMLTAGWTGYTWDQLTEVLVYPEDFDADYRFGRKDLSGQAHPWGIVILSAPALLRSFAETDDGYHLGAHEFAHLLDLAQSRFDGIPPYLSDESIRKWLTIMEREEDRLRRGDSELRPYGLSGPEELFAVAVEAFFQTPAALTRSHSELYAFLSSYFRQDPAAWISPTSDS